MFLSVLVGGKGEFVSEALDVTGDEVEYLLAFDVGVISVILVSIQGR